MDVRTDSLVRAITRIGILTRDFASRGSYPLKERGLGRAQMNLLFALSRADGMSVAELAAALAVTSGAVSQLLDELRERALITNEVNPRDRRSRVIRLTDDARAEVNEFERSYFDAVAPAFDALATNDIVELDRILASVQLPEDHE